MKKNKEDFICIDGTKFSTGWGTLHIHTNNFNKEEEEKLSKAFDLLSELGIGAEQGHSKGVFDFELDWSLRGAHLSVRKLHCMSCNKEFEFGDRKILWKQIKDGLIYYYPFCNEECFKKSEYKDKEVLKKPENPEEQILVKLNL